MSSGLVGNRGISSWWELILLYMESFPVWTLSLEQKSEEPKKSGVEFVGLIQVLRYN